MKDNTKKPVKDMTIEEMFAPIVVTGDLLTQLEVELEELNSLLKKLDEDSRK